MSTIKRWWHRFENTYLKLTFSFFITVFLLFGYITIPLINKKKKYWQLLAKICLKMAFGFCRIKIQVHHIDNIPKGPCVIAMNHRSFADSLALLIELNMKFFVITEPFDAMPHPIVRGWVTALGCIPVIRDEKDKQKYLIGMAREYVVEECVERINAGESLVIYPEAHHEKHRGILKFKTGAIRVALETGVPLIPGVFCGTEKVMSPEHNRIHPGKIHIRFGAPIDLKKYQNLQDNHRLVEKLNSDLRNTIKKLIP